MAKPKKTKVEEANEVQNATGANSAPESSEKDVAPVNKDVEALSIINGNIFIREYSRAVHGDNFVQLAKEFMSKFTTNAKNVKAIPSDEIKEVELRYRELQGWEPDLSFHTLPVRERDNKFKDVKTDNVPFVDKFKVFTDKNEALTWNVYKKGTIVVRKTK